MIKLSEEWLTETARRAADDEDEWYAARPAWLDLDDEPSPVIEESASAADPSYLCDATFMVALGEVRRVEVQWQFLAQLDSAIRHNLSAAQQRSLALLKQDLSSVEISYNLFAETRAAPATMRESFHHAKCYVSAVKRFHRLMTTLGGDGWPKPVATALRQLVRRDSPKLDVYTAARNAIEHVDQQGRAALWWMAMLDDDLAVSKEQNGNEIRVRVVGGEALEVAAKFVGEFLRALVAHYCNCTEAPTPSTVPAK